MRRRQIASRMALSTTVAVFLMWTVPSHGADSIPKLVDPVAGTVAPGIFNGKQVTYAADGGTTQAAQMTAFFKPFAKVSGVKFLQDAPQTLAKIEAQVKTKNYQWDFVSATAVNVARNCDTLFEKLDLSQIDTSHVPSGLLDWTPCGVPSIAYGIVLVYQNDAFQSGGPQTWQDFFDVAKFPGKRAVYSGNGVIDEATVQAAAIAAGWDPKTDMTSEWADKAIDKLESIKNDIVFYSTGAQAQQMLESGEVAMGGVWNGRALAAERNGAKLTPEWNDWIALVDQFAIIKGTPKAEIGYYAINYAMGAKQQAEWTELSGYSPVNSGAKPDIDELTKKYITTTPDKIKMSVPVQLKFWSNKDQVAPLQDRWSNLVAGG